MTLRPHLRRPVRLRHLGVVQAQALWYSGPDEGLVRTRILQQWLAGATVSRHMFGRLVRLPRPMFVDTRASAGMPLLITHGRLASAPIHRDDANIAAPDEVLVLMAGKICPITPGQLVREDPSTWISLTGIPLLRVTPLGPPPTPAVVAAPLIQVDVRHRLGIGESGARAAAELVAALSKRVAPNETVNTVTQAAVAGMALGLGALWRGMSSMWGGEQGQGQAQGQAERRSEKSALERWGERLGMTAALQRAFGLQHAQYLQKMLDLFSGNDLDQALRHAIPLSGVPSTGGEMGMLGWLMPKNGLGFAGRTGTAARSLFTSPDLFSVLKQMYRRAFDALDKQGRVREAAYVLSELLGEVGEALAYLEKHREFTVAAELAESKHADKALAVLLWLRAGDKARAVALAKLHNAWDAVIVGLERRGCQPEAEELRILWARSLARAGRRAAAVEVLWPVAALRHEAVTWLDEAITEGGVTGATALARKLAQLPEHAQDLVEPATRLLSDTSLDGSAARRTLSRLLAKETTEPAQALSRALARALVRDGFENPHEETVRAAHASADASQDGAIRADLPVMATHSKQVALARRGFPLMLAIGATDTGMRPIHDVVLLPRGRLLVALGELGVRIIDFYGRELAQFAAPAHRLVTTPDGSAVILAARRAFEGSAPLWRLSRLDTAVRRVSPWCDARLDRFCDTFDGERWFVAENDQLTALDAQADGLRALWRVDQLADARRDATLLAMGCTGGHGGDILRAVVPAGRMAVDIYRYELPGLALRGRDRQSIRTDATIVDVANDGLLTIDGARAEQVRPGVVTAFNAPDGATFVDGRAHHGFASYLSRSTSRLLRAHVTFPTGTVSVERARLAFDGAKAVGMRGSGVEGAVRVLAFWDDLGRLRVLGVDDSQLLADLRL